MFRCLAHAAGLNHRHQNKHVVQADAAFYAFDLVHDRAPYRGRYDLIEHSITPPGRDPVS